MNWNELVRNFTLPCIYTNTHVIIFVLLFVIVDVAGADDDGSSRSKKLVLYIK